MILHLNRYRSSTKYTRKASADKTVRCVAEGTPLLFLPTRLCLLPTHPCILPAHAPQPTTNPLPTPPPPATRLCEQEKDARKKIQADIDQQYEALTRQTEAMLVKHSSLVTNDNIAKSIVGVLCNAFRTAPNVRVVLVLNSCFSIYLCQKIQALLTKNKPAGFIEGRCCVLYTGGQWPGSVMPPLLHTILVAATASDATQSAMKIACLDALEKSTQSYAEAGGHGQPDNNTDPLEYCNLLKFGDF